MCVYICIHICVCVRVCVYIYINLYSNICICIYADVDIDTLMGKTVSQRTNPPAVVCFLLFFRVPW